MRTKEHHHTITVRIVDVIEFSPREADFLRQMAKHCIATQMQGSRACELLVDILDRSLIPVRPTEPVYGIFEEPSRTPIWIRP